MIIPEVSRHFDLRAWYETGEVVLALVQEDAGRAVPAPVLVVEAGHGLARLRHGAQPHLRGESEHGACGEYLDILKDRLYITLFLIPTTAVESLHVVFFSMLARTFPASSLNSRFPDIALPTDKTLKSVQCTSLLC